MKNYLLLVVLLFSLPLQAMELGLPVAGVVNQVHVLEGQQVKKGQKLLSLDLGALYADRDAAKAQVEYLQLNMDEAQREFERNEELYDRGQIADREYQQAQVEFAHARSKLSAAKAKAAKIEQELRYGTLRAPVAGTVKRVMTFPGQALSNRLEITPLIELAPN
jgi:RND family efflux transporter MFP subunit